MEKQDGKLVVFDTNCVERYLVPLLHHGRCDVFDLVRERRYLPAICIKSFYEICHHAKLGSATFGRDDRFPGYPGGIEVGKEILAGLVDCDVERNVYWWFGLCEEWRGLDWDEERERVRRLVRTEEQESALAEVEVRRRFAEWKFGLSAYCDRIWEALVAQVRILTDDDVEGDDGRDRGGVVPRLTQDIARDSILPSEDLELVALALAARAAAFVTDDRKLSLFAGLSLNLNHPCAFLHPQQLAQALDEGLRFRWSVEQTGPKPSPH